MVYFRIHVVRPSRKNNALFVVSPCVSEGVLTLLSYIVLEGVLLFTSLCHRLHYLILFDMIRLQDLGKLVGKSQVVVVRQERMSKSHSVLLKDVIHVVGYYLRVRCNYRTVVVVRSSFILVSLVVDARIEYPLHALLRKPFNVAVHQLCRIACRV